MTTETTTTLPGPTISFKDWLNREYFRNEFVGREQWDLAFEIHARWDDTFPGLGASYEDHLLFLIDHGACHRCQSAFKRAWSDYIADG